jgi:NADH dehydrogenase
MSPRIVVLGAGYSGLVAAKLAAKRTGAAVTLVNASDRFVERVRLHQLATGQRLRDAPLAELLDGTGVTLVVDRVTAIDAVRKVVRLGAREVPYDLLVYALGSRSDIESVPGVAEHAFTLAEAGEALRLKQNLTNSGVVAVVGGGLTGIEAAAELAESRPDLTVKLVTGGAFGGALSNRGRRHLHRTFRELGIEVHDGVRVAKVLDDGVALEDGGHIGADAVVWTTGFRVSALAREAGFAVDDDGRMIVDETSRSVSHPDVHGIGDAAATRKADGQLLRMACATGMPAAGQAVCAMADRLAGREPKPLRFRYFNQCISLGRRNALIQFVRADDSPVEAVLTGRLAALYKEAIVRGAFQAQRHPVLATLT